MPHLSLFCDRDFRLISLQNLKLLVKYYHVKYVTIVDVLQEIPNATLNINAATELVDYIFVQADIQLIRMLKKMVKMDWNEFVRYNFPDAKYQGIDPKGRYWGFCMVEGYHDNN